VSRIERWIANPYEIFARDILKLEPIKPLGTEPDHALRGGIVHQVLHEFARDHPHKLPDDICAELIVRADRLFAALGGSARVAAFWRPQLERFARWFAATEPARRASIASTHTELDGTLELTVGEGFRLTARADRIDVGEDGSVKIYDYKTGRPSVPAHVEKLFAPQLPLEAAIAEGGGFEAIGARRVNALIYIQASGRQGGGDERPAANAAPHVLAEKALEELARLVACFDRPDTAYEVKRRPGTAFTGAYRYDEYEQLARIKEWLTLDAEEDFK
jgi:ATP-dependent helicase/nuclease subunit B